MVPEQEEASVTALHGLVMVIRMRADGAEAADGGGITAVMEALRRATILQE